MVYLPPNIWSLVPKDIINSATLNICKNKYKNMVDLRSVDIMNLRKTFRVLNLKIGVFFLLFSVSSLLIIFIRAFD